VINVNSVRQTDAHSGRLHIVAHALAPLMTKKRRKKVKKTRIGKIIIIKHTAKKRKEK
jgi:hypothetical protein